MEQIRLQLIPLLDMVLQHPDTPSHRWLVGVVALLVGAWVFLKVCDKMDLPNVGIVTGFIYASLGAVVTLLAMSAGKVYLAQYLKQFGPVAFYSVVAVVASLVIFVPLLNTFIKGKYLGTLLSWSLGVAAGMAMVLVMNTALDMVKSGERVFQRGQEHNETTKQAIR